MVCAPTVSGGSTALYGVYLDAVVAFAKYKEWIEHCQSQASTITGMPVTDLDKKVVSYGHGGDPGSPGHVEQHRTTQEQLKRRVSECGRDCIEVANMFIVSIYQYWEDEYRKRIARHLGKKRNELKMDIFGDLRWLRNSIIHHSAVALPEVERNRIVTKFRPCDRIEFTKEDIEAIVMAIRTELASLDH